MRMRLHHRDASGTSVAVLELEAIRTLSGFGYFTVFTEASALSFTYHTSDFHASTLASFETGYLCVEEERGGVWTEPRNSTYFFDSGFTSPSGSRTVFFLGLDVALSETAVKVDSLGATLESSGKLLVSGDAREVVDDCLTASADAVFSAVADSSTWSVGTFTPPILLGRTETMASLLSAYRSLGSLTHYWEGFELHLCVNQTDGLSTGVDGTPFVVPTSKSLDGLLPLSILRIPNTDRPAALRVSYIDGSAVPQSFTTAAVGSRPYQRTLAAEAPESVTDSLGASAFAGWYRLAGIKGSPVSFLLKTSLARMPDLQRFSLGDRYSLEGEELELSCLSVYLTPAGFEAKLVFGAYNAAVEKQLSLL